MARLTKDVARNNTPVYCKELGCAARRKARSLASQTSDLQRRSVPKSAAENWGSYFLPHPKDQWESVRAEREAGASFPELATKWGVSHQAVQKQAKAGKWGDGSDVAEVIRRKVAEKVAGVVAGCNPQKKEAALDAAAALVADVVEHHRSDTAVHRERFGAVPTDFEEGKHAKIRMETILLRIKAERASYGLDDTTASEEIHIVRSYGGKA